MGLLTLLYARTTSASSFKYSILNDKVKKLKRRSKSAGNNHSYVSDNKISMIGTPETLRNEITVQLENIKPISSHVPTHSKPANEASFGHYLAGLIDGNGYFDHKQQLIIVFNYLDASLAYYIKQRLGFGSVRKLKNKNALLLIISSKEGIKKIICLISNKIRTKNILNQVNLYISNNTNYTKLETNINLNLEPTLLDYWLAGLIDAKGSFQIKTLDSLNSAKIGLNLQIDHKEKWILTLIKNFLGGNISYDSNQNNYFYCTSSYGSARKTIKYLNSFHLLSCKYTDYFKWRKVYTIIQNNQPLDDLSLKKVLKLKKTIGKK